MEFCYYPNHEYGCERVKYCPHLGSASLGTLVLAANTSDEILGARIGPRARAIASFLRNDIGISLRKVPRLIEELLELSFVPATLLNFEKMLASNAKPVVDDIAKEDAWLRRELNLMQTYQVDHEKAQTLQQRIVNYADEWTVFLDDPRVPPTNNLAERALRPLVVLRKIIFTSSQRSGCPADGHDHERARDSQTPRPSSD